MTNLNLNPLIQSIEQSIDSADTLKILDEIRTKALGKKGELTELLKSVGNLPASERPQAGQIINSAKERISARLNRRIEELRQRELNAQLISQAIDVTLPFRGFKGGSLHPVRLVQDRVVDICTKQGFIVLSGPEIEDDFHCFEALNMPSYHPARSMHDTFYITQYLSLRSHTTTVQVRSLETLPLPLRMMAPGRVYRKDMDPTHTPMFHQMEGLLVDKKVTFIHLKHMVFELFKQFFDAKSMQIRFRPSYFPYTQPSAEVDILLPHRQGWLEMGGCGMVHPQVFKTCGIDPEVYQGYAFGFGLDRLAMLYYQINDLRLFFENDLRLLSQF